MALYQLTSMPSVTFKRLPPTSRFVDFGSSRNFAVPSGRLVFQCMAATRTSDENIARRSANYQPSIWPFDFVQSLGSNYRREPFAKRVEKLKKEVRTDAAYREIFNNFRDKKGNFVKDCKGILSLYEAAFLLKDEENVIFHDVRGFTTSYLKEYVRDNKDQYLATLVSHALELPLNWRMLRLEARWFIDVYEARPDMKNILLELAKLDYNMDELKRGDVAKSIQCYMHETGASEEDSREHIQEMITEIWMKMNRERLENPHLSNTTFIEIAMNLARMAQCMYQHGDGHGIQDRETKDRVLSLLVNPIAQICREMVTSSD
ncbi:hypothetical protein Patl1_10192 [Pistacia atlantica]|uniref:Uncharacterized protein n=1 Tax=Pistacia atlantica TaxID=434234 RepID=A0ACC1A3S7_9ROSI|nr:hypothetical protein Patl1_10192 [Pistacia atlantica]